MNICATYLNGSFYLQELLSASMCYIHPYGVEVHNAALKLCKLKPQNYTLQLIESEVCCYLMHGWKLNMCQDNNLVHVPDCMCSK